MNYTVEQLAKLSGVSARTLRYYDGIGLLRPSRAETNGYRVYGEAEVDALQQILVYRALGVELKQIGRLMREPSFDRVAAMENHLGALIEQRAQTDALIENVRKTLRAWKGVYHMSDKEKFEGIKRTAIEENDRKYGAELDARFGKATREASNRKAAAMNEGAWNNQTALEARVIERLKEAMATGDPTCEAAKQACEAHRAWLCGFWPDGAYTQEAHRALGEAYVTDERFRAYYDQKAGEGAATFLRDAINANIR